MGLFSKKFKKAADSNKPSNDNADKKDILDDEAIPAVGTGATAGALITSGGIAAGMVAVGAATIPLGIGLPIIAGGAVLGAISGKFFHSSKKKTQQKQQQNKKGPKGPSA